MLKLPKNDGAFEKQIEAWKNEYLKSNNEAITEDLIAAKKKERLEASKSRLESFWNIPSSREKMKQEYCRLEAKRVRLLLDGRNEEAEMLGKKLKEKKELYKKHFCRVKR